MSTPTVKESRRSKLANVAEELVAQASDSTFDVTTFFEKFKLLFGTPTAFPRLRKCILHFAVYGHLTDGEINDKPIDIEFPELAKSIEAEGESSLKASWRHIKLGSVGAWRGGGTPSKNNPSFWQGDIPWVSPKDMKSILTCDAQDHISTDAIGNSSAKLIPTGSILMVVRGMILSHTFPVSKTLVPVTINQDMKSVEPAVHEICDFVLLVLRAIQDQVLSLVERSTHGTCKLNTDALQSLLIPLPPLAEQKRIVAKVDELMGLCDRLEALEAERSQRHASLSRAALSRFADSPTPTNLQFLFHNAFDVEPNELRETILSMAVLGKLVPVKSNADNRTGFDANDDGLCEQLSVPAHWGACEIGAIIDSIGAGWSPKCDGTPARANEWGVLKTTAVQTLRYDEFANKRLPPNLTARPDCEVQDGDILFTRAGPFNRVGIVCVARPTRAKLMLSDKIIRIHLKNFVYPEFAALALNTGKSSEVIQSLKSGMAASQVNISQTKLRSIPLPIPPLAEQKRIVAKVDELMALVDKLEQQLAHSRTLGQQLLEAVVAELTKD